MVFKGFSQRIIFIMIGLFILGAIFLYLKIDLVLFEDRLIYGSDPRYSNTNLSERAIRHGKQQIRKMLKDRPKMHSYVDRFHFLRSVSEEDSIWQWVVRKYAGEDFGKLVDWNSKYPPQGWLAVNRNPIDRRGSISINIIYTKKTAQDEKSIGKELSFEDSWACAIFELININHEDEFHEIFGKAADRKLTKEEFVMQIAKVEFETVKKIKEFYYQVWRPWAIKHRFRTSSKSLFAGYATAATDLEYGYLIFGRKSYFDFYRNIYDRYFTDIITPR